MKRLPFLFLTSLLFLSISSGCAAVRLGGKLMAVEGEALQKGSKVVVQSADEEEAKREKKNREKEKRLERKKRKQEQE